VRDTEPIVTDVQRPQEGADESTMPPPQRAQPARRPVAPVIVVVLLLVLATVFNGGFQLRNWAPPTVLVLAVLGAATLAGGPVRLGRSALAVAIAAIAALAAWSLLSMAWAESPARAWEGGTRLVLYAGLFSVPALTLRSRRSLETAGAAFMAAISFLAVLTLVRILAEGGELFLAGRLDAPVGYRNATASLFALGFWPLVCLMAERDRSRLLRALAFAAAVLCLGLAFLTQSRGMVVGLVAGGAVAVLLGPDRVRRAWMAILAIVGIAAASPGMLTAYHAFDGGRGIVRSSDVVKSGTALAVLVVVSFAVALALATFDRELFYGIQPVERLESLVAHCRAAVGT